MFALFALAAQPSCGKAGYDVDESAPDADDGGGDAATPEQPCGNVCTCQGFGCRFVCSGDCAVDCPMGGCSIQCSPMATCLMWCNSGQFRCGGSNFACRQYCR